MAASSLPYRLDWGEIEVVDFFGWVFFVRKNSEEVNVVFVGVFAFSGLFCGGKSW
jgi:hypothetical protein